MKTLLILLQIVLGFIALILALVILLIAVLCISALFVNTKKNYTNESRYYRALLNTCTKVMTIFVRIRFDIKGRENIPETGRFLLVCNHRSKFDPILTWLILGNKELVFISKPENFKVPAFGRLIHRLRFIPIDRENIAASACAFREGTALLKNNKASVAVYPEGTRSLDCKLLPFHAVVFTMASHANVPVLVMSIEGTEKIRVNFPWKGTKVRMNFIETIEPEWIKEHGPRELSARAEQDIKNSLERGK